MKFIHIIAAFTFAAAGSAFAAGDHDHKPLHGGIVSEARGMDVELVAKPEKLQLHLRDHGKPIDVTKAKAKVTLMNGQDKQEVELFPSGNHLEASGTFKVSAGTKVIVVITAQGKQPATARFVLK